MSAVVEKAALRNVSSPLGLEEYDLSAWTTPPPKFLEKQLVPSCLTIEGVQCFAWEHPQPFPFNTYANTAEVVEFLRGSKPSAVLMDGLRSSLLQDIRTYRTSYDDLLARGFAETGNFLLLGDFVTNFSLDGMIRRDNTRKFIIGGTAGCTAAYFGIRSFMETKKMQRPMTRREFLRLAGLTLAGGAVILGGFKLGIWGKAISSSQFVNNCDTDNPILQIYSTVDDPYAVDTVYRTGITAAKQARMLREGFYNSEVESNIAVWGTDHLYPKAVDLSRSIAASPAPAAQFLLDREIEFYLKKGLGMTEALHHAAELGIDMAGIIPLHVIQQGDTLLFDFVDPKRPIFFDDQILGFNSTGLPYEKIMAVSRERALGRVLAIQERMRLT